MRDTSLRLIALGVLVKLAGGQQSSQADGARRQANAMRRVIARDPQDASSHYELGVALNQLGQHAEALKEYHSTISLDPQQPAAYYNVGVTLNLFGRYREAAQAYRDSIKLEPKDVDVHYNLAVALGKLGQPELDQAVDAYRRVTDLEPRDFEAHHNSGVMLGRLQRWDEAVDAHHRALSIHPRHADAHTELGKALLACGADATYHFQMAVRNRPSLSVLSLHAEILQERSRNAKSTAPSSSHDGWDAKYSGTQMHSAMLRDAPRNVAYRRGIDGATLKDKVVLDLGCGSGLLAMMAAEAGARRVYCVESSAIAEVAKKVVRRRGLEDVVVVLRGDGATMAVPELVDVIVSEWMSYALTIEPMWPSLLHARERWLRQPGGLMLPGAARLRIALVEATGGADNATYHCDGVTPEPDAPRSAVLRSIGREEIVSDVATAWSLNMLTEEASSLPHSPEAVLLTARQPCLVSSIGVWFDVDFGSGATLATGPEDPHTHWQQVVLPLREALPMAVGEALHVDLRTERVHAPVYLWSARLRRTGEQELLQEEEQKWYMAIRALPSSRRREEPSKTCDADRTDDDRPLNQLRRNQVATAQHPQGESAGGAMGDEMDNGVEDDGERAGEKERPRERQLRPADPPPNDELAEWLIREVTPSP